jgi:hypothetical protein
VMFFFGSRYNCFQEPVCVEVEGYSHSKRLG